MKGFILGVGLATAGRALIPQLPRLEFVGDVSDSTPAISSLLAAYADDFVLHFNDGAHRWTGDWVGKTGMDASCRSSPPPVSKARSDRSRSAGPYGR